MAALSNEIYLPYDENEPLTSSVAAYIKREIMCGEVADALFGLATQGIGLSEEQLSQLRARYEVALVDYVGVLENVRSARPAEFYRKVLAPLRRYARKTIPRSLRNKLLARLSLKQYHIRNCIVTFYDYALIVNSFVNAHIAELEQVSGAHHKFFVVRMASGDRKQLMYDLTARLVDSDDVPVNMIIVSPWARTGWNVIKPNVLIDATATRDVTAWQQLRGRAMRTWTNECYRLVLLLMGSQLHTLEESITISDDVAAALEDFQRRARGTEILDEKARELLLKAHKEANGQTNGILREKIERGVIADFSLDERKQVVAELMLTHNKVTHIYELVKAYGSTTQIQFDRPSRSWKRTESITRKHSLEYAVNPISGEFANGASHAPLIYAGDPRKDVPSELERHLVEALRESDPRIINGWLTAIASDTAEVEEMGLE